MFAYAEQPDTIINLWPTDPPGQKIEAGPEQDMTKDSDALIAGRRIIKLGNVSHRKHTYICRRQTFVLGISCDLSWWWIFYSAWDLEGQKSLSGLPHRALQRSC